MKELFLLKSILNKPEIIDELYFLEPEHFNHFKYEFEFIKNRWRDLGEVSISDLLLHGYSIPETETEYDSLDIPIPKFTENTNKIIHLGRFIFEQYHKKRILAEIKKDDCVTLGELESKLRNLIDSINDEFLKNKLDDNIITVAEKVIKETFELRNKKESKGLTINSLPTMNKIIGGLMPTDLVGIYGKEKSAKTTLATEIMLDLCIDQKHCGAIFNYEMDNELTAMKIISLRTGLDINEMRNPQFSELSDNELNNIVKKLGDRLRGTKLFLIDQILNEYEIEAKIKRLIDKNLRIVMIDYLLLIPTKAKFDSFREKINHLTSFFKKTAQKYKIVIILISQANDQGERAAEGKGLERDSNYYFYTQELQPNKNITVGNLSYTTGNEPEYFIQNRGLRHGRGNKYFFTTFNNNKYGEIETETDNQRIRKVTRHQYS